MTILSLRGCALALAALLALPASAADYVQAPGSTLAFAGKYQDEVFVGRFPGFVTTLSFDPARPGAAHLEVDIPLAGATTDNADYDAELRDTAFLDAARFPRAHYQASGATRLGNNRFAVDGVLSLHGIERPVRLEFTWTPGPRPVLAGQATVRRLAFGVGAGEWADTGLIADEVAISTRVVLQPAP